MGSPAPSPFSVVWAPLWWPPSEGLSADNQGTDLERRGKSTQAPDRILIFWGGMSEAGVLHQRPGICSREGEEGTGLGVLGREGTGWSVLDQWSLRRNPACPGGGLDTKSSPPSPALGPHMFRLALGPPQDSRRRGSEVS